MSEANETLGKMRIYFPSLKGTNKEFPSLHHPEVVLILFVAFSDGVDVSLIPRVTLAALANPGL